MAQQHQRAAGYPAADEVKKLTSLRDSGAITAEELGSAKAKAWVEVDTN